MFTENISKRCLWRLINKKIKRLIHNYHVFSIISILFEEIIKDLIDGKSIKIHNFGILELVKTKPKNIMMLDLKNNAIKWKYDNEI